ncbi:hypothetical protein LK03_15515 [Pseudomonas cremoricolorata]|uniref:Uncharacterized protein n=1 Tax=Pseudomonas cremoricolorata TaxID=157783 RepID=A0A089YFV6_9PSED|nr:hypothetical protein LK03_15515 [Pseudomonas cremoricolorata]
MVDVVEVVSELRASNFINSERSSTGRVVKDLNSGHFKCQVDARVDGVDEPDGNYQTADEAINALVAFWRACDRALEMCAVWEFRKI